MSRTAVKMMLIPVWMILAAVLGEKVLVLTWIPSNTLTENLGWQFIIIFALEVVGMVIVISPFVSFISISRHAQKPYKPKNTWVVWLPFVLFTIVAFAAIVIWPLNGISREGLFWYAFGAEICGMVLFSSPALYALHRS